MVSLITGNMKIIVTYCIGLRFQDPFNYVIFWPWYQTGRNIVESHCSLGRFDNHLLCSLIRINHCLICAFNRRKRSSA